MLARRRGLMPRVTPEFRTQVKSDNAAAETLFMRYAPWLHR
jgi:hypothetical protein